MRWLAAILVGLATATIAVGAPLCCVAGLGCCGTAKQAPSDEEAHCPCCPHDSEPAEKPCKCGKEKHDAVLATAGHHLDAPHHLAVFVLPAALPLAYASVVHARAAHADTPPPSPAFLALPLLL